MITLLSINVWWYRWKITLQLNSSHSNLYSLMFASYEMFSCVWDFLLWEKPGEASSSWVKMWMHTSFWKQAYLFIHTSKLYKFLWFQKFGPSLLSVCFLPGTFIDWFNQFLCFAWSERSISPLPCHHQLKFSVIIFFLVY